VGDDDVTQGTQEHSSPPQQALVFGHGNEEEVHAPSTSLDIPRCRACKLRQSQQKNGK
jgi:hypothetical protein